jgi:hypothetical protein
MKHLLSKAHVKVSDCIFIVFCSAIENSRVAIVEELDERYVVMPNKV